MAPSLTSRLSPNIPGDEMAKNISKSGPGQHPKVESHQITGMIPYGGKGGRAKPALGENRMPIS